jgi:Mg-chelatase subunit ChlD
MEGHLEGSGGPGQSQGPAEEGLEFNSTQMVPLVDVSGSMSGVHMEVAIALGIGISEIHEPFRDRVLTFETNPSWFRLKPTDAIVQKVRQLQRAPWGGITAFAKAYDMFLQLCLGNKSYGARICRA